MNQTMNAPEKSRPADPCTVVIFGGAGDLTRRKLVPALYDLRSNGFLSRQFCVIGVARKEMTHDAYRELLGSAMREFAPADFDEAVWKEFLTRGYYVAGPFGDPE